MAGKSSVRNAAERKARQIVENTQRNAAGEAGYTPAEMAELFTPRTVSRLVEHGFVTRSKGDDGQWSYDRAQVDAYLKTESARKPREQLEPEKEQPFQSATVVALRETIDLLKSMLAASTKHTIDAFAMAAGPAESHVKLLQATVAEYAKRCADLETRHVAMLELLEKVLTSEHERRLETRVVEAQEERRAAAFKSLTNAAPGLFTQLVQSLGGSKLMATITDEQLQVLTEPGMQFLTDEQRDFFKAELARRAAKAKIAANGATEPS